MENNILDKESIKEGFATLKEAEANKLTPKQISKKNSIGFPTLSLDDTSQEVSIQAATGYAGIIHLHKHMTRWAVYPTSVAPVTGNQCGYLSPSQFNGLSYFICWNAPYNDVYCIWTETWGYVHIYVPHDSDSCFNAYSTFCTNCYERHSPGTFDWNRSHKNCNHNFSVIG